MDKPRYEAMADLGFLRDIVREMLDAGPLDPRKTTPAALASLATPLDILDVGAALIVQINLPGVTKEDVQVQVIGDLLTINAEVKPDPDLEGAVFLRRERRYNRPVRNITLPVAVVPEQADASYKNGVLTIKLPKVESVVPTSIKVNSE